MSAAPRIGPWRPPVSDVPLLLSAGALAAAFTAAAVTIGPIAFAGLLGVSAFALVCLAFARAPHVAFAALIVFLIAQPVLLRFVDPAFGPAKDILIAAAALGVGGAALQRRAIGVDAWLAGGVALLLGLYALNPAGIHDPAWANGARIVAEALVLLCVGAATPQPIRTWRWAVGALIVAALVNVGYGLIQRMLGVPFLVEQIGYIYGAEVRETTSGMFRAFGSFEEPFSYAAVLLFALVASVCAVRSALWASLLALVVTVGIAGSAVRTALVLVPIVFAIGLARVGRVVSALALSTALILTAVGYLALSPQSGSQSAADFVLTLNGRTESWTALITSPFEWAGGRGVGDVGVGARRAAGASAQEVEGGAVQPNTTAEFRKYNVDSSYLATVADVGLVGLAVLLALLARAAALGFRGARRGSAAGWMAVGLTAVLLIDALTRTSLTSFPSGYIGLLMLGLSLAAARAELAEPSAKPRRPPRHQPEISPTGTS